MIAIRPGIKGHSDFQGQREARLVRLLSSYFLVQIAEVLRLVASGTPLDAKLLIDAKLWHERLILTLTPDLTRSGRLAAAEVLGCSLRRQIDLPATVLLAVREAVNEVLSQRHWEQIQTTTRAQLTAVLNTADPKQDRHASEQAILSFMGGNSQRTRAERIAHVTTAFVVNAGRVAAHKELTRLDVSREMEAAWR